MKDTKYRKSKDNIRSVSINIIKGDYTEDDMFNSWKGGKKWMIIS